MDLYKFICDNIQIFEKYYNFLSGCNPPGPCGMKLMNYLGDIEN